MKLCTGLAFLAAVSWGTAAAAAVVVDDYDAADNKHDAKRAVTTMTTGDLLRLSIAKERAMC